MQKNIIENKNTVAEAFPFDLAVPIAYDKPKKALYNASRAVSFQMPAE